LARSYQDGGISGHQGGVALYIYIDIYVYIERERDCACVRAEAYACGACARCWSRRSIHSRFGTGGTSSRPGIGCTGRQPPPAATPTLLASMAPYSFLASDLGRHAVFDSRPATDGDEAIVAGYTFIDEPHVPVLETAVHVEESLVHGPIVPMSVEESRVALAQSDLATLQATLAVVNLPHMNIYEYVSYFGVVDDEHRFGRHVWYGIRAHLREYRRRGGRGSPSWASHFMTGWFAPPLPFGREGARMPLTHADAHHTVRYPAVFAHSDSDEFYMWCLNILVARSKHWRVHHSRVFLVNGVEFINFQLEV